MRDNIPTMQCNKNLSKDNIMAEFMGRDEFYSCQVAEFLGVTQSRASQYLKELSDSGMLTRWTDKDPARGRRNVYRVPVIDLRHQRLATIENGAVMGCHRGER